MNVGEVLKRLENGEKLKDIGDSIGVSPRTMQRRMKKIGYVWNNSVNRWEWSGPDPQPLEMEILETTTKTREGKVNTKRREGEVNVKTHRNEGEADVKPISRDIHTSFTADEIKAIRSMLLEWQQSQAAGSSAAGAALHERIKDIKNGEKVRKTIVINKDVGAALDQFAERERVNKSDILEIAIMDFINKYS